MAKDEFASTTSADEDKTWWNGVVESSVVNKLYSLARLGDSIWRRKINVGQNFWRYFLPSTQVPLKITVTQFFLRNKNIKVMLVGCMTSHPCFFLFVCYFYNRGATFETFCLHPSTIKTFQNGIYS